MEENESKVHEETHVHHHKKKELELTMPMAIVLGAFIIAIAIIVVKIPRTVKTETADSSVIDADTINILTDKVLSSKNKTPVIPIKTTDHMQGSTNPKITIIEYSDLECPFCKNFDFTMNKVMKKYSDNVAWVYRHFPLDCKDNKSADCTPLHSRARHEAIATECAFEQGGNDAFWEYTNQVFSVTPSNNRLDPMQLSDIAQNIRLNLDLFNKCLSSEKYASVVSDDVKDGLVSNTRGTPLSIIVDKLGNTYSVEGAYPYEVMSNIIDNILQK